MAVLLVNYLVFALAVIPIIFAILLLLEKDISKKIFGAFFIVTFLWIISLIFHNVFYISHDIIIFNFIKYSDNFFFFFFSINTIPFYYLYVKSVITEGFKWNNKYLIHFLPSFIYLSAVLTVCVINYHFFYIDMREKIRYLNNIASIVYYLKVLIYTIFIVLMFIKHQNKLKNYFSYKSNKKNLNWLKVLLIFFVIISILDFLVVYHFDFNTHLKMIIFIILPQYFYHTTIGILSLKQPKIYYGTEENDFPLTEKKEHLSDEKSKEVFNKVIMLMEEKQLFKKPDLSIYSISKELDINMRYISYSINREAKTNFLDFINAMRVKEAEKLLKNKVYNDYTIEYIGSEAGFRSQQSFNFWFKRLMGTTPSNYKKSLSNTK